MELRAQSKLEKTRKSQQRLNELKAAVNLEGTRTKRALVDGGGKILYWLFGGSTQEDLEHVNNRVEKLSTETTSIVHALEVHASLINETLWQTQAVADAVIELQTAFTKVENGAMKIDKKIGGITHEIERQRLANVKVEDFVRHIESAIAWIDETIENFAIGLATMAMERLPPTLFPPLQVQVVLREIKGILPAGWSLSPSVQTGDTWKVYKEAKVIVAAVNNGLRIFIHLPVFEFPLSFTLYEVISLPRPVNNSTQGAQFQPLPPFLAVANDRQAFVELTSSDSSSCLASATSICPNKSGDKQKTSGV